MSVNDLCRFIDSAVTPFHAVATMITALEESGYKRLSEESSWSLNTGGCYFITRNDSSLIAFTVGDGKLTEQGLRMIGAHTDSPCLKVKPHPEIYSQGLWQLGVEVYGGALLNPWFDRDLSLAGRCTWLDATGKLYDSLIDFKSPVVVIPSLAIHLDREANRNRSVNAHKELPAILLQSPPDKKFSFREILREQVLNSPEGANCKEVLDFEISLYPTQPAGLVGLHKEFVAAPRLDNLLSCYTSLQALLSSSTAYSMLVFNDHEEVGSATACGAAGPFLEGTIEQLLHALDETGRLALRKTLANSLLISADNAHAVHPNFADKHDSQHGPRMNGGPVLKYNASQRYATNSRGAALFRRLCQLENVGCQSFVMRSDLACGSTIGPIVATELGVTTIDVGLPTLAMHSVRELAGASDINAMVKVLGAFLQRK
jgi:aspartyl aminopeptidase